MRQSLLTTSVIISLASLVFSTEVSSTESLSLTQNKTEIASSDVNSVYMTVSRAHDNLPTPYSLALAPALFNSNTKQHAFVISYKVESKKDTLAFTFSENDKTFKVISSKGASKPGTFVQDTLSLANSFLCENCCGVFEGEKLQTTLRYIVNTEQVSRESKNKFVLNVSELHFLGEKPIRVEAKIATRSLVGSDNARKFAGTIVSNFTKSGMSLTVPVDGVYEISLMATNGRVLEKKSVQLTADAIQNLGVTIASTGIYLVQVEGNGIYVTERVTLK